MTLSLLLAELPEGKRHAGNLEEFIVKKVIENTTTGPQKVNVKEITMDASTTLINLMSKYE